MDLDLDDNKWVISIVIVISVCFIDNGYVVEGFATIISSEEVVGIVDNAFFFPFAITVLRFFFSSLK